MPRRERRQQGLLHRQLLGGRCGVEAGRRGWRLAAHGGDGGAERQWLLLLLEGRLAVILRQGTLAGCTPVHRHHAAHRQNQRVGEAATPETRDERVSVFVIYAPKAALASLQAIAEREMSQR